MSSPDGGTTSQAPQPWNAGAPSSSGQSSTSGPPARPGYGDYRPSTAGARGGTTAGQQPWNSAPPATGQSNTAYGSNAGLSGQAGAYRPGSTSRNAGLLTSPSTRSGQTSTGPTGGSPSSIGGASGAYSPSNQTPAYGGTYSYPTTGQ
jgi:hypothetical protein